MSVRISGSALERVEACPVSGGALPSSGRTTEASLHGTENHAKVERGLVDGVAHRPVVAEVLAGSSAYDAEVAFALDVEEGTARVLGVGLGRNYAGLRPGEIPLTTDLIVRDRQEVWDWKSRKRVTTPGDNLQLLAAGLACHLAFGWEEVKVGIGYLDNGHTEVATLGALELVAAQRRIQTLVRRAREATPETAPHTGPWCEYCPSMSWCPAQSRLALAVIGELDGMSAAMAEWTPDQAGRAWEKLEQIEAIAERVRDALKMRARKESLPLSGGKRLVLVECERRGTDNAAMAARLSELGEDMSKYQKVVRYDQIRKVKA